MLLVGGAVMGDQVITNWPGLGNSNLYQGAGSLSYLGYAGRS